MKKHKKEIGWVKFFAKRIDYFASFLNLKSVMNVPSKAAVISLPIMNKFCPEIKPEINQRVFSNETGKNLKYQNNSTFDSNQLRIK